MANLLKSSMTDTSSEREEEILKMEAKARALGALISASEGKILKAKTTEQAKEALLEFCFFSIAYSQVYGVRFRLKDREEQAGEMGEWSTEAKQQLEDIAQGDWVKAKEHIQGVIEAIVDPVWTETMDMDENFTYKGVAIFKEETEESYRLLSEYIKKQVNLVPDKTEPYTHPNLESLKSQVAAF